MQDVNVIGYVIFALLCVPVFAIIFADRITDWLIAREERKKAAAEAKIAEFKSAAKPA